MALRSTQPDRNEYQESSLGVKSGRRVMLTTLPPFVSRLSKENVGASASQPYGSPTHLTGIALPFTIRNWSMSQAFRLIFLV
jgi:hypothetical protein